MQIKRYRAADMQEALQKVKQDLGANAIILSTRQVRGGGATFGLFGKPMLEVTAARETPESDPASDAMLASLPEATRTRLAQRNAVPALEGPPDNGMEQALSRTRLDAQNMLAPLQDEIQELKDVMTLAGNRQRGEIHDEAAIQQIRTDISEMRNVLQGLSAQQAGLNKVNFHDNLIVLYQQLMFNGVEEKFAHRLIEEAQKSIPPKELEDFSYVKIFLARMLMKITRVTGGITVEPDRQKIVALVGPTGVGKTTTVAKLASEQLLQQKRKVSLITVDTFRIAAVEQLKVYAKIMGVPITVVQGKQELEKAIRAASDADVVFVDTGGRSPRDDLQMAELIKLFGGEDELDIFLGLSSTTKDADLGEVTRRFSEIPLKGIVFTKLDESSTYGSLFNHAIRFKLPIAYLTTGQKVPEDIEVATKERLVDLLLNITGT